MKESEDRAMEQRVRQRGMTMWEQDGRPKGREADYIALARELIAIESNPDLTAEPVGRYTSNEASREPIEPIEAVTNQGDFPTLTDQGEEQTAPSADGRQTPANEPLGTN